MRPVLKGVRWTVRITEAGTTKYISVRTKREAREMIERWRKVSNNADDSAAVLRNGKEV